ncbi:Uncharacterised protein [uncultured archaeon]|nr:Uncharacterised protein [uncultured archaeon]
MDLFSATGIDRQILLAAAAALAVIVALLALVSPSGFTIIETGENVSCGPPLLFSGENYSYSVASGSAAANVSVWSAGFDSPRNCYILHQESSESVIIDACYSKIDGNLTFTAINGREVEAGAIAGLGTVAFEPWMACAREGWTGQANSTRAVKPGVLEVLPVSETVEKKYSVNGTGEVFGRRALKVVEVTLLASGPEGSRQETVTGIRTVWVDEEKKVLLKEEMGSGGATITHAPFPLETEG